MTLDERLSGVNRANALGMEFSPGSLLDQFSQEVAAEIGLDPHRVAGRIQSHLTRVYEQKTHTDAQRRG